MAEFDEMMENRVWQRIHAEGSGQTLQSLAVAERSTAAVYLRLARMTQGPEKALLRQLFERERRHSRCIHGVSMAAEGKPLSMRTVPPAADHPTAALRKCYAASLKAAAEYDRRGADPDYGCVFRELAREEREHCRMILEVLGGQIG